MDKSVQTDGGPVLLTGFDPLTTDVLSRILTRRGIEVGPSPVHGRGPALVVVSAAPSTISGIDDARSAWADVPLVVVVPVAGGSVRQAARRVAAAALVPRSAGLDAFAHAVGLALAGGTVDSGDHESADPLGGLTERETAVLGLVARGATNAEIGDALGISPHTARTHVQNVLAKLGVRNRLAASVVAREAGLMPLEAP